jgi:hypothetical protein
MRDMQRPLWADVHPSHYLDTIKYRDGALGPGVPHPLTLQSLVRHIRPFSLGNQNNGKHKNDKNNTIC